MSDYDRLARYYDELTGDARDNIDFIRTAVNRWCPTARTMLELGCGTGSVLAGFTSDYELWGVDQSRSMLEIARVKVPEAHYELGDIATFEFDRQFDLIVCVFDTINHLTQFREWIEMFDQVARHLVPGGLFIFDVNTLGRLDELAEATPVVEQKHGRTVTTTCVRDGDVASWSIEISGDDSGAVEQFHVVELAVGLFLIRSAISADFELLLEDDGFGYRPNDESERGHFVCRVRRTT